MDTADVVVVGAGAVGCSVAYFLARRGMQVLLMDQEAIGSGASTHATGSFSLVSRDFQPGAHFQLGVEGDRLAVGLIPQLEEETGIDTLYQRKPELKLALDEEEEALLRHLMSWQGEHIPLSWIDGDEVRRIEPRLTPQVRCAVRHEAMGQLDSYRLTLALAQATEKYGGSLRLRRVTGLTTAGDRVTGVTYDGDRVSCGSVVLAMGVWSSLASQWLHFNVPVRPLKGERILLGFSGEPLPVLMSSPKRGHMIHRRDGFLSVGSTGGRDFDPRAGFNLDAPPEWRLDNRPTEEARLELIQRAIDVMPCLEEAEVVQQLAGDRPMSADLLPIIGPVPGWQGVYLATGHTTKGIHLGPITGQIIANLIITGQPDVPFSMEPFAPGRFGQRLEQQ